MGPAAIFILANLGFLSVLAVIQRSQSWMSPLEPLPDPALSSHVSDARASGHPPLSSSQEHPLKARRSRLRAQRWRLRTPGSVRVQRFDACAAAFVRVQRGATRTQQSLLRVHHLCRTRSRCVRAACGTGEAGYLRQRRGGGGWAGTMRQRVDLRVRHPLAPVRAPTHPTRVIRSRVNYTRLLGCRSCSGALSSSSREASASGTDQAAGERSLTRRGSDKSPSILNYTPPSTTTRHHSNADRRRRAATAAVGVWVPDGGPAFEEIRQAAASLAATLPSCHTPSDGRGGAKRLVQELCRGADHDDW